MARSAYRKIPIVDAARRCGLVLDSRTIKHSEVEASCPFCGDHGKGKYHLSLNTDTDQYRCNLCGASGNSVTLYARLHEIGNKEAFLELTGGSNVYALPHQPVPQTATEREPKLLKERHAVYEEMLGYLTLTEKHRNNLLGRGLSDGRIAQNQYRSMPETPEGRRLLGQLVGSNHDLLGVPGFYTRNEAWTVAGPNGFLIPVRDKGGLIQGLKIRLDDADNPGRKYRWLSSRHRENGTRSFSYIHVSGDITRKRVYITEGPLKGDVASSLAKDALFVCTGGVNAMIGLTDTLIDLGVTEAVEAMDMDQMVNPNVRNAVLAMRREIQKKLPQLKYSKYTWNPAYKGVDDYFLSRAQAM